MRKKQNKMTKNKRMEATAVMMHAASELADLNKVAMTEILFCLIKPTWFNLYKSFLFPSRGAEEGLIFLLLPECIISY